MILPESFDIIPKIVYEQLLSELQVVSIVFTADVDHETRICYYLSKESIDFSSLWRDIQMYLAFPYWQYAEGDINVFILDQAIQRLGKILSYLDDYGQSYVCDMIATEVANSTNALTNPIKSNILTYDQLLDKGMKDSGNDYMGARVVLLNDSEELAIPPQFNEEGETVMKLKHRFLLLHELGILKHLNNAFELIGEEYVGELGHLSNNETAFARVLATALGMHDHETLRTYIRDYNPSSHAHDKSSDGFYSRKAKQSVKRVLDTLNLQPRHG